MPGKKDHGAVRPPQPPPRRGQIWNVDLGAPVGHEQAYVRPFLILSVDRFNDGGAGLVIGIPLTTTDRGNALHVRVQPPEGSLDVVSFAQTEAIRSISKERLGRFLGYAGPATLARAEDRMRILLGL